MNNSSSNKKQGANKNKSLSEHRESDTPYTDLIEEMFYARKGKGNNPNSKKNLIPFKKGQSGNPGTHMIQGRVQRIGFKGHHPYLVSL